jgi:hypothetical protein
MCYSNPSRIINCKSLKTEQVDVDTQIKYLKNIISEISFSNNGSGKSHSSYNSSDVAIRICTYIREFTWSDASNSASA